MARSVAGRRTLPVRRLAAAVLAGAAVGAPVAAYAVTAWVVGVGPTTAVGKSQPLDPTGVTAACAAPTTSRTVTVSWNAVPHATYAVSQATAAAGPWTVVASGLTATSWTSGALKNRTTYYFEVTATVATWTSPPSAPTTGLTMANRSPFCA